MEPFPPMSGPANKPVSPEGVKSDYESINAIRKTFNDLQWANPGDDREAELKNFMSLQGSLFGQIFMEPQFSRNMQRQPDRIEDYADGLPILINLYGRAMQRKFESVDSGEYSDPDYGQQNKMLDQTRIELFSKVCAKLFSEIKPFTTEGEVSSAIANLRAMNETHSQKGFDLSGEFWGKLDSGLGIIQKIKEISKKIEHLKKDIRMYGDQILSTGNYDATSGDDFGAKNIKEVLECARAFYTYTLILDWYEKQSREPMSVTSKQQPEAGEPALSKGFYSVTPGQGEAVTTIKIDEALGKPMENQRQRAEMEIKENLLIDEILTVGQGLFEMSLPQNFSFKGHAGFQTIEDGGVYIEEPFDGELKDKMEAEGRLEGILIEPKIEDIMEQKEIKPASKGFLGIGGKPAQYQSYRVGQKNKLFSEIVPASDIHEPAYLLSYLVNPPRSAKDDSAEYRDYSNRRGQFLGFKILIPESLLQKISQTIESGNVEFIRKLAKEYLKRKLALKGGGDFEKAWEDGEGNGKHPLKPPYSFYDKNKIKPIVIFRT